MPTDRKRITLAAVGLSVAAAAAAVHGAELPMGRWHGVMTPAGGAEVEVELSFADMAGRPLATLSTPTSGLIGLSNIAVTDDALSFGFFKDGSSVKCRLARQADGGYAGPCVDRAGGESAVRIAPVTAAP